ncbi:elongator complex protein 1-like isoform X2 [Varroa jacobsoni]|uniref:elongator complex protein 1-like isoform X2 n=1 Tax=Varroa jacobsoni TaxID=62625 RepID=UPI000BF93172|nr:elongator complex protein 1-like isoform X2 [Varroa jacobsoni]
MWTNPYEMIGDIFGGVSSVAWSPDLELLVVVSTNGQLLLMRENFSTIIEQPVETESLGEKSAITVGWGKKETQFHGSEGKRAATVVTVQKKPISEFDDRKPNVIWRNDGQYFATNTVHNDVRTIRIWSRDGVLQYTAETIPELHGALAWWWGDENLIVSVDTSPKAERRIIFYETNGLRHGQFTLPENTLRVKEVCQGTLGVVRVLTVYCSKQIEGSNSQEDVLLLFTMNNYHWYLKQTLSFPEGVRAFLWDSRERLRVMAARFHSYRWSFQVDATGEGRVASIDAKQTLVTDFDKFVIPPPMAQRAITVNRHINSIVLLKSAILLQLDDGSLVVNEAEGNKPVTCNLPDVHRTSWSHLTRVSDELAVGVTCSKDIYKLQKIVISERKVIEAAILPKVPECLTIYKGNVFVKLKNEILSCNIYSHDSELSPSNMGHLESLQYTPQGIKVGFDSTERCLYYDEIVLCHKSTSFVVHEDTFILVTTNDNTLKCYSIFGNPKTPECCDTRNLEAGSLLVTSAPTDGRVILQMPRGNIETIYPRPLMLHAIQSHLMTERFDEAFRLMKVNRINMNLFYDYDPSSFDTKIEIIVRKLKNVNDLNLMIMDLQQEDVTQTMYAGYYSLVKLPKAQKMKNVDKICDRIRETLAKVDEERFLLSIITCYAKKNTISDLEVALLTAKRFEVRFDEALKYLILLVDINRLMDVALGTYDFKIFLNVAQHSKKDPKEYLALLKELKSYKNENYRKVKTDMYLKRYDRALLHLAKCPDHFGECLELVIKERLFTKAHSLFPQGSQEANALWNAHGDYLLTKKRYKDAAIAYMQAKAYQNACQCFERAVDTDLCLAAAKLADLPAEPIAKRLILALTTGKKCLEASKIMERFSYPAEEICMTLISGSCWKAAFCWLLEVPDDRQEYIKAQLREHLLFSTEDLKENIATVAEKFSSSVARLKVVREEKAKRAAANCINFLDDTDLPMSEAGSVISGASRTCSSHTTRSGSVTTIQSNRQLRKANRKPKYILKQGSPFEDLAIVQECAQLVKNVPYLIEQVVSLLTGLQLLFLMDEAASLQSFFGSYFNTVKDKYILEVWPETPNGGVEVISDEELRIRPVLPVERFASAIFSERW